MHTNLEWKAWGERDPLWGEDEVIDAVFSRHVFQHLPNVQTGLNYFAEIKRVLKPGGSFMIHLPNAHYTDFIGSRFRFPVCLG